MHWKYLKLFHLFSFLLFHLLGQSTDISSRFPNRSCLLCPGIKNVCFNKCSCILVCSPVLKVYYIEVLKQNTLNQFLVYFQVVDSLLHQYACITYICVQYITHVTMCVYLCVREREKYFLLVVLLSRAQIIHVSILAFFCLWFNASTQSWNYISNIIELLRCFTVYINSRGAITGHSLLTRSFVNN